MTSANKYINPTPLETYRKKLVSILDLINELKEEAPTICNPPGESIIASNAVIQSASIYLQAAGSTHSDNTTRGIDLRWSLTGELGEKHIPKGTMANVSEEYYADFGYNKNDDYVTIYRTPYSFSSSPNNVPIEFDLSSIVPDTVFNNEDTRRWAFNISNTYGSKTINNIVVFHFTNVIIYDTITVDPYSDPVGFIQAYNDCVAIEVEGKLMFAVEINIDSSGPPTNIKYETIYSSTSGVLVSPQITSRKTAIGSADLSERIVGENIQFFRFHLIAGDITIIKLETYEDFLRTRDNGDWDAAGYFGLTDDDTTVELRLEDQVGGITIDHEWPRFKDGIAVKTSTYLAKWEDDGGLRDAVEVYLLKSKTDLKAEDELLKNLTEGEVEAKLKVSYLELLNLAAKDFHVARMLGLGHIDININLDNTNDQYVYVAIYSTNLSLPENRGLIDSLTDHIYMSLPTAMTDYRLPPTPKVVTLGYGFPDMDPCAANAIYDIANGYAWHDKIRFFNINRTKYDHEIEFESFFENTIEFDITQNVLPILYGIQYKLKDAVDFVKPEITSSISEDYYDYDTGNSIDVFESIPIWASKNPIFVHAEKTNGAHEYALYAINWFSRTSVTGDTAETEYTNFDERQVPIKGPEDILVHYIQEENPNIFTTETEQTDLGERKADISVEDPYWTRITFNWNHLQKMAYQTADTLEFFFRTNPPKDVQGRLTGVIEDTINHTCVVTCGNYLIISSEEEEETIVPTMTTGESGAFIGSFLITEDGSFEITNISITSNIPTFTVKQNLEKESFIDPDKKGEILTRCKYTNPTIESRFILHENLYDPNNWTKLDRTLTLVDFSDTTEEINDSTYFVGGINGDASVELITEIASEAQMNGLYKIQFDSLVVLNDHPEKSSGDVFWYKGVIRIPETGGGNYKTLQVIKIETGANLIIWAYDPEYDSSNIHYVEVATSTSIDISCTFHPGYRLYLKPEASKDFDKDTIQDFSSGRVNNFLMAFRAKDSATGQTGSLTTQVPFFSTKNRLPQKPSEPVGPLFATRPDIYGKSTYTIDIEIEEEPPFSLLFARSNDTFIFQALYEEETIAEIMEAIGSNELDGDERSRYHDLVNLEFYSEEFAEYNEYALPLPDKIIFSGGTTFEQKVSRWKLEVLKTFIPVTEQAVIYDFIKEDGTATENKKPVLKDVNGQLLDPDSELFDPFPNVRKYVSSGTTYVRITDYQLDGASKNIYFYMAREISDTLRIGPPSNVIGPVHLVNSIPAEAPYIRKFETVLEIPSLEIRPGVRFEINSYLASEDITKVAIYRTINKEEAATVRTMQLATTIDLSEAILDDFANDEIIPFGDDIFYRLVALRKIKNELGDDEYIPSKASELCTIQVVDAVNPEPPEITWGFDSVSGTPKIMNDLLLTWEETAYKGKYYLYKMSAAGQWQLVQKFDYTDTLEYNYDELETQDEDGDKIYHRFKVVAENRNGLLSINENIATVYYSEFVEATGGVVTIDGNYKVHTFTNDGTFKVTNVGSGKVEVLMIGGGGGGGIGPYGSYGGGGAGAGEFKHESEHTVSKTSYAIAIGEGGNGATAFATNGTSGEDTTFDSLTAIGGGFGAGPYGGSGGNGASSGGGVCSLGSAGAASAGHVGSAGHLSNGQGGAGGGAGSAASGLIGGDGIVNAISGSEIEYGKGGDGTDVSGLPYDGADGVHYGDGGSGGWGTGKEGGNGKKGVVILKYLFKKPEGEFSYVISQFENLGVNGGTCAAFDSTDSTLIVVSVTYYAPFAPVALSDNKSNTWIPITPITGTGSTVETKQFYCINPTAGSGHTFTIAGSATYASIYIDCFKCNTEIEFSDQNGNMDNGSVTIESSSITPPNKNCLFVTGINFWMGRLPNIDSGFTITNSTAYIPGVAFGGGSAYKISSDSSSENPTWDWTNASGDTSVSILCFNPT